MTTIDTGAAPAPAVDTDSGGEMVWDGHGWAGAESPQGLVADEMFYAHAEIGGVFVLTPRTRLGVAVLTIHAPDRWDLSAPVPEGCNLIEDDACPLDGTEDTVTRTIAELVAELIEYHGLGDGMSEDDTIEAEITYWRQGEPQAFRLDIVPCELPLAPSDAHEASGAATSEEVA